MRISSYSGAGNPNGKQSATVGALYIDTDSRGIYYKATGSDSYGWQLIWSTANLVEGVDFLSPSGDGSQVQNLNANNVASGVLKVSRGGTGIGILNGILKGNGTGPVTTAIAGEDYLVPGSLTGLIMYCPTEEIPEGWLICDGTIYDTSARPELIYLLGKLGNKYGGDGLVTFGVPNLTGRYVKGGEASELGNIGGAVVGGHTHSASGTTGNDGAHTHNKGSMNITGQLSGLSYDSKDSKNGMKGAFSWITSPTVAGAGSGAADRYCKFDAASSWTGTTSSTPHRHSLEITVQPNGTDKNDVDHIVMIPIIKY
jgi:microcystin-dependent protein